MCRHAASTLTLLALAACVVLAAPGGAPLRGGEDEEAVELATVMRNPPPMPPKIDLTYTAIVDISYAKYSVQHAGLYSSGTRRRIAIMAVVDGEEHRVVADFNSHDKTQWRLYHFEPSGCSWEMLPSQASVNLWFWIEGAVYAGSDFGCDIWAAKYDDNLYRSCVAHTQEREPKHMPQYLLRKTGKDENYHLDLRLFNPGVQPRSEVLDVSGCDAAPRPSPALKLRPDLVVQMLTMLFGGPISASSASLPV